MLSLMARTILVRNRRILNAIGSCSALNHKHMITYCMIVVMSEMPKMRRLATHQR